FSIGRAGSNPSSCRSCQWRRPITPTSSVKVSEGRRHAHSTLGAAVRLFACLTMCLIPVLAIAAQTDDQAPSDPQAYCVNRSADFYPYMGEPCKSGYHWDQAIAENLTGEWLPCQESSATQ